LDTTVLTRLVEEASSHLAGRRVRDVVSPARDLVVLRLDGPPPSCLVLCVAKALPVLCATVGSDADEFEPGQRPPGALANLKGSTLTGIDADAELPVATLSFHRVDQAGTGTERAVVVDLGRRPSLAVRDGHVARDSGSRELDWAAGHTQEGVPEFGPTSSGGVSGVDGHDASTTPTLGWRRDSAGRLHVGLPAGDRPWDETATFQTWSEAAEHAVFQLLPEIVTQRRRGELRRSIRRLLRRKKRALDKVEREISDSARAEEYRHKGQLLLTRQRDVGRGQTTVELLDYDNETVVEVDLDPAMTPARNAEVYFARARKAERRARRAPERRGELETRIGELEARLAEVDEVARDRLAELEDEFAPPERPRSHQGPGERARFRTYVVSGGWKVLVGKSNRDNDVLTHRIASPDDLWFHVRQSPGSHVVLRREGKKGEPQQQAILEAAAIAAFHSKARGSSGVSVSYAERRYVRKPRGAKPGLAVMSRENVVFVEPGLPGS